MHTRVSQMESIFTYTEEHEERREVYAHIQKERREAYAHTQNIEDKSRQERYVRT